MIGDTIADFGNKRMFILKAGGIGKPSVINIINAALGGMSCNLDSTLALSNKKIVYKSRVGLDKNNLLKIASKRLVLLSDLDITPDVEIDMQTIKVLTGGDTTEGIKLSTTVICSMNKLPHYNKMSDYTRADRVRRIVVVPTVDKRKSKDNDMLPVDTQSLNNLIVLAIITRIKYSMPPLSPECVLYTLFQSRATEAFELVEVNPYSTLMKCMAATMILCWHFEISPTDTDDQVIDAHILRRSHQCSAVSGAESEL